ncbi:MAG: crossover junction endodeoxyribonuclease RuvC [Rudaea sp.]|uniref:crossover junction endodeoxyribonuclease RuvC n=1 Tax=Rudaea sp. TaxID=2136325 RepID=UPI0039E6A76D
MGAGSTTRILGIDPGSQRTGVGIVDVDAAGRTTHVFHAAVNLLDNENFSQRLKQLFDELRDIVLAHRPHEVAIERVFMARNADSALKLGQARGAAICAVVAHGLFVAEYSAKEIKQSVVGGGGAEKRQVQHMVGMLLNIERKLQADAADALAVALTHAHARASAQRLRVVVPLAGRARGSASSWRSFR